MLARLYVLITTESMFISFFTAYFGILLSRYEVIPIRAGLFIFLMGFQMLEYPFVLLLEFDPTSKSWLYIYNPPYFQVLYLITSLFVFIEVLIYYLQLRHRVDHTNKLYFSIFLKLFQDRICDTGIGGPVLPGSILLPQVQVTDV